MPWLQVKTRADPGAARPRVIIPAAAGVRSVRPHQLADAAGSGALPMNTLFWRRIAAFLLDVVILFLVLGPFGFLVKRMLGIVPAGREIYVALLVNFSFPVWAFFTWADAFARGGTFGKRAFGLEVVSTEGGPLGVARALLRTAVKLLPWETVHVAVFLLPSAPSELESTTWIVLAAAYVLAFAYLMVVWRTFGERAPHDLVARTQVARRVIEEA
jgi:uncharacterized RDD family membrane protein YckC